MSSLLKKLNYKAQDRILVLGSPAEFEPFLSEFQEYLKIDLSPSPKIKYDFIITFSVMKKDLETALKKTSGAASEDCLYWFAYPKKTSKKYKSDLTRDEGWQKLGDLGYEGVRMIAIDDDWSAMRFKKADKIKTMKRNEKLAMSSAGKKRTRQG